MQDPLEYIARAFEGFRRDPADSDYQRGYLAALATMCHEAFGVPIPEKWTRAKVRAYCALKGWKVSVVYEQKRRAGP